MLQLWTLCVLMGVASVLSLRLEDAEEGSCRGIRYKAMPNVDLDFVDSLNYISAANRYHIYRHASSHPRFSEMREFELYYNLCLTQNTTYSVGDGSAFGFGGRILGSYTARPRRDQPGVIDTVSTTNPGPYDPTRRDRMQQFISLTDHRTFAFLTNCWVGADQRSFDVFSLTPELSTTAKRMIEEHAISLGFNKEDIVFLNYNNCGDDPLPDTQNRPGGGGGGGVARKYYGNALNTKKAGFGTYPPVPSPRPVPFPKFPESSVGSSSNVIGGGKVVSSRATINPVPGNVSLKSATGGLTTPGKLSLASAAGAGWSR